MANRYQYYIGAVRHSRRRAAASKGIQGAKHKPTDNQDFKPDEEELKHLQGILDTILGLESDYEAIAAFIPTQKMDADEKTWVWDKLDSKTRSGIKAIKPKEQV